MKQVYQDKNWCSGCTACQNICPVGAITMAADEEGFPYPVIDQDKCTDCGLCAQSCPFAHAQELKNDAPQTCYSFTLKDEDALKKSTSGGAFTAISDYILAQGGVIYGADFDGEFKIFHSRAADVAGRDRQRLSKYAQSDLEGVFAAVKADLEGGLPVLFTGTPCQTAGLKAYIPENLTKKLYLCDLICYSIPSPLIWKGHKEYLERKYGGPMKWVMHRSKIHPWTRPNSSKGFLFEINGQVYEDNTFYDLFFKVGTIDRPSCQNCQFTSRDRASDITIADYWNIEQYSQEAYSPLGVSVILANNAKGDELCRAIQPTARMEARDIQEQLTHQKRLSQPLSHPENRPEFWRDLLEQGYDTMMEKYVK